MKKEPIHGLPATFKIPPNIRKSLDLPAQGVSPWDLGRAFGRAHRRSVEPSVVLNKDAAEDVIKNHRDFGPLTEEVLEAIMLGWKQTGSGRPEDRTNYYPRVTDLAQRFPSLRHAPGVTIFCAMELEWWCRCTGAGTSGNRQAVLFVLQVFNSSTNWKLGGFNVVRAMGGTWDDDHRAAFLAWARDPWQA